MALFRETGYFPEKLYPGDTAKTYDNLLIDNISGASYAKGYSRRLGIPMTYYL